MTLIVCHKVQLAFMFSSPTPPLQKPLDSDYLLGDRICCLRFVGALGSGRWGLLRMVDGVRIGQVWDERKELLFSLHYWDLGWV